MTHVSKYGKRKPSSGVSTPEIIEALKDLMHAHDNDWFNFPDGSIGKQGAIEALANAKRILAQLRERNR